MSSFKLAVSGLMRSLSDDQRGSSSNLPYFGSADKTRVCLKQLYLTKIRQASFRKGLNSTRSALFQRPSRARLALIWPRHIHPFLV